MEINGVHDETQDHFAHIFAAITNISVVDFYSTVTRPLLDRYMSVTSVTALQTLKPWIFWRSGDVLSVKCSPPPPSSGPPPNYTLTKKSIHRAPVVPPPNEGVPVVPPSHVAAVEQHVPVELATSAALPAATSVHPRPVGAPPRGVGGQAKVWDTVHGRRRLARPQCAAR